MTWAILGLFIILFILSPIAGFVLLGLYISWRFSAFFLRARSFFMRLLGAFMVFSLILVLGIYLSQSFYTVLGWFLK